MPFKTKLSGYAERLNIYLLFYERSTLTENDFFFNYSHKTLIIGLALKGSCDKLGCFELLQYP